MKLLRRTAFIAAATLALAPPAFAQKSADTLRILFDRRRAQRRHVLQQPAHRPDPGAPGVGHAGASRSRDLRDQAGARHRLEVRRGQLARPHHPPGREVPRRQHALGRRRGLHHQHGGQPRQQGGDAVELRLDRQGREDRRLDRAHQDEAADAGGAGISRHGDADPSQGLSREGRTGRLRRQAGRRRPLQDRQERAGQGSRVRALRRLLGGLAQGQARDQDAACALRARPHHRGDRASGPARRLDLEHQSRPARQHQQDAAPAGGAAGIDAHRLSLDRCRRPLGRGQSADQPQGAPGDLARRQPPGHGRQAGAGRQPRAAGAVLPDASSAATPMPR